MRKSTEQQLVESTRRSVEASEGVDKGLKAYWDEQIKNYTGPLNPELQQGDYIIVTSRDGEEAAFPSDLFGFKAAEESFNAVDGWSPAVQAIETSGYYARVDKNFDEMESEYTPINNREDLDRFFNIYGITEGMNHE